MSTEPRTARDLMAEEKCAIEHPGRYRPGFPCHPCEKWAEAADVEPWAEAAAEDETAKSRTPLAAWNSLLCGEAVTMPPSSLDYSDADQLARMIEINGVNWVVLIRRAT